jgi:integrase
VADLDPKDFAALRKKLAKKWGPVTLGNVNQRIRVVFKFASDNGLIGRPVRYGQAFKRPSRKVIRIDRGRKGPKLFTADEIRRLIDAAGTAMRAMILLGIDAGMGNADCGHLPLFAVDLDGGMIDFPRPKTGIPRRTALWPETVQALREALANRPTPKSEEHAGLVFITKYGLPWAKDTADQTLAKEFGKLLRALSINGRKGLGFYTLRHTFRTVADESKDQPAVDLIMVHEVPHMSSVYRETISDERLRAVAHRVRAWLLPPEDKPSATGQVRPFCPAHSLYPSVQTPEKAGNHEPVCRPDRRRGNSSPPPVGAGPASAATHEFARPFPGPGRQTHPTAGRRPRLAVRRRHPLCRHQAA